MKGTRELKITKNNKYKKCSKYNTNIMISMLILELTNEWVFLSRIGLGSVSVPNGMETADKPLFN